MVRRSYKQFQTCPFLTEFTQNTLSRAPVSGQLGILCRVLVSTEEGRMEWSILMAEMSWLRRIAGTTRRGRIRNEVILRELGQTETLVSRISKRRLTLFWHDCGENGRQEITSKSSV